MNNDIHSLNPNVNVTNNSIRLAHDIDENSSVHEGREYTDLTHSNSLEESCEKTCTVYQDFEDDFDFDLDISFNLEGLDEIESLEEEGQQELAIGHEGEELGMQLVELGLQKEEVGLKEEELGTQEVELGTLEVEGGVQKEGLGVQNEEQGAQQEIEGALQTSTAVESEHEATQVQQLVQEENTEVNQEIEVSGRKVFNQSQLIEEYFGGFENIFCENGGQEVPLKEFAFLNEVLNNHTPDQDSSQLTIQLFDQLLQQGKLTKQLPTGEFVPLTADEIEAFKLKFTADLTTYFQKKYEYNVQLALDKKTDSNEEAKAARSLVKEERQIERREKHSVREIDLDRHSDERHIQVSRDLNILSQVMIQLIVSSKLKEEIQEEKKEKELQDIIDSIKKTILMKEILNQEILKKEIDGTELKSRVDTVVSVPMYVQVKIDEVYRHVDHTPPIKSERAPLPFPGLYKTKQMAASAA